MNKYVVLLIDKHGMHAAYGPFVSHSCASAHAWVERNNPHGYEYVVTRLHDPVFTDVVSQMEAAIAREAKP